MQEHERAWILYSRVLAASRRSGHAIFLGETSGELVFAPPEHGALVLGPPRSGKTSSIVVPNVLAAYGPVVAVSTKRDVLDVTHSARERLGDCLIFDPTESIEGLPRLRRVGWSPLYASQTWDGAVLSAEAMVGASREGRHSPEGSHWTERAAALLSTIFHGAALGGMAFNEVVSAVNRREPAQFSSVLSRADAGQARDLLKGLTETEEREQSAIWSTASSVLSGYRTRAALDNASVPSFNAESFVSSVSTLYIAAPAEHQLHLAPLVAGVLRDIRTAAYRRFAKGTFGERAPTLFVLDELANIAPLHDLPALVAEGASQGVITLACLQDLSQARSRYGPAADGFLTLFGSKVILSGSSDVRTLEALSALSGRRDTTTSTRSSTRLAGRIRRQRTVTSSIRSESRLAVDAIARPPKGAAIAFIGAEPCRVDLSPCFSSPTWAPIVEQSTEHERRAPLFDRDRAVRARSSLDRQRSG
ncbi:MAG: type IV secretory system conjugative DNA transfer family protein [Acidimicrobiales bacterium]